MSFSTSLTDSSTAQDGHPRSFSEVLAKIGFELARTQDYDWMAVYSDALPLLEAIQTIPNQSSVLGPLETEKLANLPLPLQDLAPEEIIRASRPMVNVPVMKDVGTARRAKLKTARTRLRLLEEQREALRDAICQKKDAPRFARADAKRDEQTPACNKVSLLISKTEVLRSFTEEDPVKKQHNSEVIRYCEKEAKHSETVATVITQSFREDLKAPCDHHGEMTLGTKRAIKAYAEIQRKLCLYRALVIRDAAIINSLGTNDGKYLEMTASSMLSLIRELRGGALKGMQSKAEMVSEEAREALTTDVCAFSQSERASRQDAYLDAMKQCISLYLAQRMRIHSLKSAADIVMMRRERIFEELQNVSPTISPVAPSVGNFATLSLPAVDEEVVTDNWQDAANEVSHVCEERLICQDEAGNKMFSSHLEAVASHISPFAKRNGQSTCWLNLSSNLQSDVLTKELEYEIGKNTALLEALLQKKASIMEKASPSAHGRSPSRNWVQLINASHSPRDSFHSSTSSFSR